MENAQTKRKTLPQTGANNSLAIIGLGIASVLASLGLSKSRKRKN